MTKTKIDLIQNAIAHERNNFGDHSVSGNDLELVAHMAILLWNSAGSVEKDEMLKRAMFYRSSILESMSSMKEHI